MNLEGRLLGNRYEIMGRIGTGGMADVYKALDHTLNRFVAIKIMKKEYRVLGLNTNLIGSVPVWLEDYGFNTGIAFSDYDAIIIDSKII